MTRREFILALGGAAAWPLAGRAQQRDDVRRVGVLTNYAEGDRDLQTWLDAFRRHLEALGWNDARLQLDYRFAAGDLDRIRRYADDLVSLKPDVAFGEGTPVIAALQRATTTIPIVFVGASNSIGSGFVASMARPGGNITGFVSFEPAMGGKWLQILKEIAPGIERVALAHNPQTHTGQYFSSIEAAARTLAVEPVPLPFGDAGEIERAADGFARGPKGGLLVLPDPSTSTHRDVIVRLAAQHRLPAIYPFRYFTAMGGLASYGADRTDQYRRAAEYVDRILKGAKPSDLPVQTPTKFELVINLKTAGALGLTVSRALLARADEVIE